MLLIFVFALVNMCIAQKDDYIQQGVPTNRASNSLADVNLGTFLNMRRLFFTDDELLTESLEARDKTRADRFNRKELEAAELDRAEFDPEERAEAEERRSLRP
eukprot:TRINITY_DN2130_c0_g1_i12.p2 TRINITY_DN2130_c0_g1~~TRINITY_DN2130_c0_g1_i12.p2  ORF type:complete len:103 (-),score=12.74 TRINITY_DN2130_c0_g1_i12:266-574(-)